jgi:chromosome segregation ATPase
MEVRVSEARAEETAKWAKAKEEMESERAAEVNKWAQVKEEMEAEKVSLAEQLAHMRSEHAAEMGKLTDAHEAELVGLREKAAGAEALSRAMEEMRVMHAQQLADVDAALQTANQQLGDALSGVEAANRRAYDAESEVAAANEKAANAERELEKAKMTADQAANALGAANQRIAALEKEVDVLGSKHGDAVQDAEVAARDLGEARAQVWMGHCGYRLCHGCTDSSWPIRNIFLRVYCVVNYYDDVHQLEMANGERARLEAEAKALKEELVASSGEVVNVRAELERAKEKISALQVFCRFVVVCDPLLIQNVLKYRTGANLGIIPL